jgi:hypothetical protein
MKSLRFSGRAAVICSLILAIGIPSVAMGFGEGRSLLLGKRNPSSNANLALNSETEIIADTATYGTRQSNKKDGDGGGAIYGCRSNPGNEPCIRANNLKGGRAFEFVSIGKEGGRIEVGGDHTGPPLTTNATGVATGFNADKVDGKEAADFAPATALSFALVSDANPGTVAPTAAGPTAPTVVYATTGADNDAVYTIDFKRDVSKCSYTASVAGSAAAVAPGVSSVAGQVNQVAVNLGSTAGATQADPRTPNRGSFHVQVIC